MTPFNNELQVGQPALVIGCHHPENIGCIGRIVTIVDFVSKGDLLPSCYMKNYNRFGVEAKANLAVITGSGVTDDFIMIDGHIFINVKYLMPLPPLDDDVLDDTVNLTTNLKVTA